MNITTSKNISERIKVLGKAARDDASASCWSEQVPPSRPTRIFPPLHFPDAIYTSVTSGGRQIRLFKILLDNRCRMDCHYCALRSSLDTNRCGLEPEDLARAFLDLYRRRAVEGLFLSSAIPDLPERVQERMIKTAEILRRHYRYAGYIHLKILPGVSEAAVTESCRWADRVSVNLEAPNQKRLDKIAPRKNLREGVIQRLIWARQEALKTGRVRAGLTTQFVVGAAGETDSEILKSTDWLYRRVGLWRAYYSALRPVPGTPLEEAAPPPPQREHRLYQSDWLLRDYGFEFRELPFNAEGNLPLETDPKLSWAELHPEFFPVEINRAAPEELLRVPGIGKVSAKKILSLRKQGKIQSPSELKKLGLPLKRAQNFLSFNGRYFPEHSQKEDMKEEQLFLNL